MRQPWVNYQLVHTTEMNVIMPSEDWWVWHRALLDERTGGKGPFVSLHQTLIARRRKPVFTSDIHHIRNLLLAGRVATVAE